ncbi:Na/Pi cotransporter family protein [Xanthobacter sp. 91]|uniref:Na/Pi cotransporter family protein n=1 Tax=Xanthobacter sp. 91 TaxID=1117244 RepID=UPI000494FCA9|nr:Na/Pi cotransporter family protein [Xanthobacter sp. 91]
MSFSATLLDLAGFAALLLWGIHMVQSGVMRALGPRLKMVLGHALAGPLKGFCAVAVVTTLLQSSTATALMVSGFAMGRRGACGYGAGAALSEPRASTAGVCGMGAGRRLSNQPDAHSVKRVPGERGNHLGEASSGSDFLPLQVHT